MTPAECASELVRHIEKSGCDEALVRIEDETRAEDRRAHDGSRTERHGRHRVVTVSARAGDRRATAVAEGDAPDLLATAGWAARSATGRADEPPDDPGAGRPFPQPEASAPHPMPPRAERDALFRALSSGPAAEAVLGAEYQGVAVRAACAATGAAPASWDGVRHRLWHWTAGPGGNHLEGSVTWGDRAPDPAVPRTCREELAAARTGATAPPDGTVPVLLAPAVTLHLLGLLASTLNGRNAAQGLRGLLDRTGRRIAAPAVTVVDDGRAGHGPYGAPVDDECTPTGRTPLITDGVLHGFLHSRATATACGHRPNGCAVRTLPGGPVRPGPRGLRLLPGPTTADGLRRAMGNGIETVAALHPAVRGDGGRRIRLDAYGWLVADGTRQRPVGPLRVEVGLFGWLKQVAGCGDELLHSALFPGLAAPAVLLSEARVTG
ncbi:TldD/PmbA family protein [Streptomyces sp. I05A-00742]|uniref:TldD/PmbA family protein n=1 Tax=Streptomyces sp. I05A-00742 TaxID=2732853 RepID=UPI001487746A|nr:metallopeptidase TldD-related protein [Streptomyces sp. I05A-00742]